MTNYNIFNRTLQTGLGGELQSIGSTETDDDAFDAKLYPALVQCFAIIGAGYLAGRLNIISNSETKGLNTFVGTFALPSVIFLSLVELNWSTVNWNFLLAILISKAIVFLLVAIVTLLVIRPINYGRAGILAIFCTQSNDFAIGYPIVLALYNKTHPEYPSYIYLLAPISLAILNPLGLILMEISKMKNSETEAVTGATGSTVVSSPSLTPNGNHCPGMMEQPTQGSMRFLRGNVLVVVKIIQSIFFNPILLMTMLGVIGGIAFPAGLPEVISSILRVLGNSFAATALFLLGLRMVGRAHKLQGPGFLLPGILIIIKLLVFPLVTRQTVNIMNAGSNITDTTDLSTFGFLYGTFPAAPGVFVIATQYNVDIDLIASSMVACTFISAPLMFISAKMITLTELKPGDYFNELCEVAQDVSIASIVACLWLAIFFGITKKFRRMPHRITCSLVLSQLISSIGVVLWANMETTPHWAVYIQFLMFTVGSYSARLWTSILAISLLFLQCRSLCFVLKLWKIFMAIAWGVPMIIASLLLVFDKKIMKPTDKQNPNFQYGTTQAAISVILLVMCFIVTVASLVLHQRHKKRVEQYVSWSKQVSSLDTENARVTGANSTTNLIHGSNNSLNSNTSLPQTRRSSSSSDNDCTPCHTRNIDCCITNVSTTSVVDIEDLVPTRRNVIAANNPIHNPDGNALCNSQFNCPGSSRQVCKTLVDRYEATQHKGLEPIELEESSDEHQTLKHIVVLILLLCSMFVGLAVAIWTLILEEVSGIYFELSFLDAFLNFGQSLIVLAVFITDTGELLLPLLRYWRKIWYGANILKLAGLNELGAETKHTCEQFKTYHLDKCRKAIAKDKRWRIKTYKKVFFGSELVDWLIELGLARDRVEATHYAKHLIDGRVLRHINNTYHFHDRKFLYTFCSRI